METMTTTLLIDDGGGHALILINSLILVCRVVIIHAFYGAACSLPLSSPPHRRRRQLSAPEYFHSPWILTIKVAVFVCFVFLAVTPLIVLPPRDGFCLRDSFNGAAVSGDITRPAIIYFGLLCYMEQYPPPPPLPPPKRYGMYFQSFYMMGTPKVFVEGCCIVRG